MQFRAKTTAAPDFKRKRIMNDQWRAQLPRFHTGILSRNWQRRVENGHSATERIQGNEAGGKQVKCAEVAAQMPRGIDGGVGPAA